LEVLKGIFRGSLIFTTINLIIDFGELFMKRLIDYSSRFRILKGGKISLVVSAFLASTSLMAAPSGGSVTTGSATITQNGSITNIDQSTNKASINWQSFNIGSNETVNFNQPSSSSITLNRVVGATSSLIQGAMNANGQVFLVNPNGVLFSNGSQINVAGLVATTKNITDEDFQNGNYNFDGDSEASILNQGTINASNGYVALLGKTVSNEGTITATLGNVQLAGGKRFALQIDGNSLVHLTIDEAQLNSLVENKGAIIADGGKVHLTTQAVNDILDGMVNNTGVIEANSLSTNENGEVILFAHGGTANIDGTLKADFVETSGDKVKIAETTTVDTDGGEWLIDPAVFTIAAAGGDMTGATIAANLVNTDVTIQSIKDPGGNANAIEVYDNINYTGANDRTLTLVADGEIKIADRTNPVTIDSTNGALNIYLSADNDGTLFRHFIYFYENTTIDTNGGDIITGGALVGGVPGSSTRVKTYFYDDVTIDAENITINGDALDISEENVHITVADSFVANLNGSFSITGPYGNSDNTLAEIYTKQKDVIIDVGNHFEINAEDADFSGGSINMTGSGTNTMILNMQDYLNLYEFPTSITFAGTPDLQIKLGQGTTFAGSGERAQNVGESTWDYVNDELEYIDGDTGHFGLNGASYKMTVFSDGVEETITPKAFDNGKLAIGTGLEDSINEFGLMEQPYYYDSVAQRWFQLTYDNYSFDNAFGFNGTTSAGWNITGDIINTEDGEDDDIASAISNYNIDTSGLSNGIGEVVVTYDLAVPNTADSVQVQNTITLGANEEFIKTNTQIENIGSSTINNTRYWVGTSDDYVGDSDDNYKTLGNIGSSGFEATSTTGDHAQAILVSELDPSSETAGSAVLFHTTSSDGEALYARFGMTNFLNQDPSLVTAGSQLDDGSYGIYMNYGDLAVGESVAVTWYYGATSLGNVATMTQGVNESAKPVINYTVAGGTKTYGEVFTLPTPSFTGGTPTGTTTVKVYDGTTDVTAQAVAGTLPVGTYTVKTLLTDNTYKLDTSGNTDGTLTIGQANLNYTVAGGTKTYGEAFTLPTPSITGGTPTGTPTVKVYDGTTDVTAQAIAGTLPAGTYTVTTELSDTNYAIANSGNTDGTLTIGQANLNYTVTGGTKTYGEAFTLPTPSITGGTPTGTPTVKVYDGTTDVTAQAVAGTLSAGTYTVKVTLNDTNYIISTTGNTDGTLTINSAIEIQDIITNIVNATTVKAPVVVAPKTPDQPVAGFERKVASAIVNNTPAITTDNTLPSANIGLNELIRDVKPEVNDVVQNNRLTLVSDSGGEEKITTVDMESLMAKSGGGELRVALSPDSFVELVNGGVNLPSGVSQEFYVVEDQQ
jgi:filamentous hemagglutinin family protein